MKKHFKFRYLLLFIYILSLLFVFKVHAVETKKTVCSMTYNSNEELEIMKKYLPDSQFQFVELLPENEIVDSRNDKPAYCKKNVECDVLVISGHFGGAFFGKNNLTHTLEDLERASCQDECSGVFHHPKEVFLFGCNTLAGKQTDSRTPEEYVQVLIRDGFTPQQAELTAAFRYSPVGSTNVTRFQRIFKGVTRIGGFNTKGPTGFQIASSVDQYFKQVGPSYSKSLDQLNNFKPDSYITKLLKNRGFEQIPGSNRSSESPPICYLENNKSPTIDKLLWIEKNLKHESWLNVLNETGDFFNKLNTQKLSTEEVQVIQRIKSQKNWLQEIELVINQLDSLYTVQRKLISFLKKMELATDVELRSLEKGKIVTLFNKSKEDNQIIINICSDQNYYKNLFSINELLPLIKNPNLLGAIITCLNDFKLTFEYSQSVPFYFPAFSVTEDEKSNNNIINLSKSELDSDLLAEVKNKISQITKLDDRFIPYLIQNFKIDSEIKTIIQSNMNTWLYYMIGNNNYYSINGNFVAEIFEQLILLKLEIPGLKNWIDKVLSSMIDYRFKARIINTLIQLKADLSPQVHKFCNENVSPILDLKNENDNVLSFACMKVLSSNETYRQNNKNLILIKINASLKNNVLDYQKLLPYFFTQEEIKSILLVNGKLNKKQRFLLLNSSLESELSFKPVLNLQETAVLVNEFGAYIHSSKAQNFYKILMKPLNLNAADWSYLFKQTTELAGKNFLLKTLEKYENQIEIVFKLASDSTEERDFGFNKNELVNERMLVLSKYLMNKRDLQVRFLQELSKRNNKNEQIYNILKSAFGK